MTPPPGPAAARGTDARPALAAVVLAAALVGWSGYVLLQAADRPPLPPVATPSEPVTLPVAASAATELARIADALNPSPTAVPTERPPSTRAPATIPVYCGAQTTEGTICRWPPPTAEPPPTVPPCVTAIPDEECKWEGT